MTDLSGKSWMAIGETDDPTALVESYEVAAAVTKGDPVYLSADDKVSPAASAQECLGIAVESQGTVGNKVPVLTRGRVKVKAGGAITRGKAAKLNHAIFEVLSAKETMAVWDIFKCVTKFRGLKRKRYAVIDVRVRALEAEGYLSVAGERETKQGNKTQLFKLTAKAKLALAIGPRTIDDLVREMDEETALILVKTVAKLFDCQR